MYVAAMDTETHLIKPGMLAPRIVCFSWAERDAEDVMYPALDLREAGLNRLHARLREPEAITVGHNLPYDLACACEERPALLPLVFAAYREGRLRCTQSRQKVLDVALGMRQWRRYRNKVVPARYGLADLVELYYDRVLPKAGTWRLRYALLDDVPISEWPQEARDYALGDAVEHLLVYEAQKREMDDHWGADLPNLNETAQAAWALHLMSAWGVRAEAAATQRFIENCEREIAKMQKALAETDILKPDGSRTMDAIRRRVIASLTEKGIAVPMTDPSSRFPLGQVGTDKETLELTDDPHLHVLAKSMTFSKHLGQWGPVARAAVERPVCARYNELVDTGRTSCSGSEGQEGTNFQNPPRKGDVRPCFTPRRGWVYVSTDADTIELRAHAQNCLEIIGWSKMAAALHDQALHNGPDLHLRLGARLIGLDPYEALARFEEGWEEIELARQFAKVPNFGYPGGLGARTMIAYAAAQMDKEQHQKWFGTNPIDQLRASRRIRDLWFQEWSENREYFEYCSSLVDPYTNEGTIQQRMSGRYRGGARFTAIANGFFQGRVADAMKEALFNLAEECYTGRRTDGAAGASPLLGSRPVMFLHDEPILEHPFDSALDTRAERQREVVVAALCRWMPDVPCTSTAVAMLRWQKGAKPLRIDGRLVPSRPEYVLNGVVLLEKPAKVEKTDVFKIRWVEDRIAS